MPYFLYKETPLFYQELGHGEPVLCLHGFMENHGMWSPLNDLLSSTHRCIAPDLFGHGKTPAMGYVHEMKMYAEAVIALLNYLQIENFSVIGHSMGGYVAMEMLHRHPDRVDQLVMLNSTPMADSDEKKENRDRAISAIQKYPDAFIQMAVRNLFLNEDQVRLEKEILHTIEEAKKCSHQGIIATLRGLKNRADHLHTFVNASCKKLVIAGERDSLVPYTQLKKSLQGSNATILSFPGGHMSHLEFPTEVAEGLLHFF